METHTVTDGVPAARGCMDPERGPTAFERTAVLAPVPDTAVRPRNVVDAYLLVYVPRIARRSRTGALAICGSQPLRAPAVRPDSRRRWKSTYTANTGSMVIVRPAKRALQSL